MRLGLAGQDQEQVGPNRGEPQKRGGNPNRFNQAITGAGLWCPRVKVLLGCQGRGNLVEFKEGVQSGPGQTGQPAGCLDIALYQVEQVSEVAFFHLGQSGFSHLVQR